MLMGGPALSGGGLQGFAPEVGSLKILESTRSSLLIEAKVNITNPTNYSATVPYVDINLFSNNTLLGHATAERVNVVPGRNEDILVKATWDPSGLSGNRGINIGRELLSQYISGQCSVVPYKSILIVIGYNTSLTLRTHSGTIPSQPRLGSALSLIEVQIPTPKLKQPKNPNHPDEDDEDRDEKAPRFIDDATVLSHPITFCPFLLIS